MAVGSFASASPQQKDKYQIELEEKLTNARGGDALCAPTAPVVSNANEAAVADARALQDDTDLFRTGKRLLVDQMGMVLGVGSDGLSDCEVGQMCKFRLTNLLRETECNCAFLRVVALISGPESRGVWAVPITRTAYGKPAEGCEWEVSFKVQRPGKFEVDVRMVMWTWPADADDAGWLSWDDLDHAELKTRKVTTKYNGTAFDYDSAHLMTPSPEGFQKLKAYRPTYRLGSGRFYDGAGCHKWCQRTERCKWSVQEYKQPNGPNPDIKCRLYTAKPMWISVTSSTKEPAADNRLQSTESRTMLLLEVPTEIEAGRWTRLPLSLSSKLNFADYPVPPNVDQVYGFPAAFVVTGSARSVVALTLPRQCKDTWVGKNPAWVSTSTEYPAQMDLSKFVSIDAKGVCVGFGYQEGMGITHLVRPVGTNACGTRRPANISGSAGTRMTYRFLQPDRDCAYRYFTPPQFNTCLSKIGIKRVLLQGDSIMGMLKDQLNEFVRFS
jgi:hypothetical protein